MHAANDGHSPSITNKTMSQSLVKNYVHIVFSTKYREPLIHPSYETELHGYLGASAKIWNVNR